VGEPGEHALIGRTRELASLDDAIQRATDGRPSVVLVAGEAGIGKSALLAASLARAADAGVRTLSGHCLDRGAGGYPYAPFVEIFRSLIVATEAARLPALLGPARGEFARLLPELAGRIGGSTLAPLAAGPGAQVHPTPRTTTWS
jgi:predicted ATPase